MNIYQNVKNKKGILLILVSFIAAVFVATQVIADDVPTAVTVGNEAPVFTVDPIEGPPNDGSNPQNAGNNINFIATATDSSSEDYYLAVCQTNAITAVNGGAPTCPGGEWVISSAITSGNQANIVYASQISDAESNDWYAFVCDGNSSNALCSASSQGSGVGGSPFYINHRPVLNKCYFRWSC